VALALNVYRPTTTYKEVQCSEIAVHSVLYVSVECDGNSLYTDRISFLVWRTERSRPHCTALNQKKQKCTLICHALDGCVRKTKSRLNAAV